MTIRLRLTLLFVIGTLIMLIGTGVVFVGQLEASLEATLTTTLATRAYDISRALAAQTTPGTVQTARIQLATVNGVYAQLLDGNGRVLDSSRATARTPLLSVSEVHRALVRRVVVDNTVSLVDNNAEVYSEPLRILGVRSGPGVVVAVAISRDVVDNATSDARAQLLVLSSIVLLLGAAGSWLLIRAALHPVERMRAEVAGLHERNEGALLRVPDTRDEIARLAETFNKLLTHLEQSVMRERAFVADASHEFRTPLTVLTGELELARRPGRRPEEVTEALDVAAEETERLVRLTDDLLSIARDTQGAARCRRFDLASVLNAAITATEVVRLRPRIAIDRFGPTPMWVTGNPDRIRRAVDNLLINAVRHSPDGSSITVTAGAGAGADERSAFITVSDEGPGFPPDFLPVAFDRFTRADDARTRTWSSTGDRTGSGLGLAIVQAVMTSHGGRATARNRAARGAEVVLTWTFDPVPVGRGDPPQRNGAGQRPAGT